MRNLNQKQHKKGRTLPILAIAITATAIVAMAFALANYTLFFPQRAAVPSEMGIKVFTNAGLTSELTNTTLIDWGTVSYGVNTKTYWIKNIGNSNVTLSLLHSGLPAGWTLTWDYTGTALAPSAVRQVVISLTVPLTATEGTYNWNSWVTADKA